MPKTSIAIPSNTSVTPKLRAGAAPVSTFWSRNFWKTWKMVKPKLISDSEVRITDISVRSALMRVRWNDMPVRRADSSTEISSDFDFDVTGSMRVGPRTSLVRRGAPDPTAGDACDRTAEDDVGEEGQQQRDKHGFSGVESLEHLVLVNRIHA